jgi:hypothetical protein
VTDKNINDQIKILIPVIRKNLPAMLAQDIVSVQPMGLSKLETGETYVDEAASYATDENIVEWYWARLPMDVGAIFNMGAHGKFVDEVEAWCEETFGPRMSNEQPVFIWDKINGRYCFKRAEDRTAFVLKWS